MRAQWRSARVVHGASSLYTRGMQYASDFDSAIKFGKQGLGSVAPNWNNVMPDVFAQSAHSGAMHGIGAYDKARGEFMATHGTVMDKTRQGERYSRT